jgi:hypothetical protein
MEAEYVAGSHSAGAHVRAESAWRADGRALTDNQSTISIGCREMHDKAKHIALKYHYIRNLIDENLKDVTVRCCEPFGI